MRNFYKLFFALAFAPCFALAQNNFQPGIAVTLKGDTIRGYINYAAGENNQRTIPFKADPQGQVQKLTVNDIKYYAVSIGYQEEYVKYDGLISTNSIDVDRVTYERDSTFKHDAVFLRILQKGKNAILYSFSDDFKTRYFIAPTINDAPVELIYRVYYVDDKATGRGRTANENTYKTQLYAYAEKAGIASDAGVQDLFNRSTFERSYIVAMVSEVNGISQNEAAKTTSTHAKPFKLVFALVAFVVIAILVLSKTGHN